MERAMGGYERLCGRGDTRTLEAMFQLGQLYAVPGNSRGAEELFKEAVRGRERLFGRKDEKTEEGRELLGMARRDLYGLGREEA